MSPQGDIRVTLVDTALGQLHDLKESVFTLLAQRLLASHIHAAK
jgi:hypothetical protein